MLANGTGLPNTMLSLAVEQQEDLEPRFKLLSAMRVSGGTAYNYGVGARAFVRFALFYGCTPVLPASDLTLARFVAFQSQSCSKDTLQTYISHIRDLHLRAGYNFRAYSIQVFGQLDTGNNYGSLCDTLYLLGSLGRSMWDVTSLGRWAIYIIVG